MERMPDIEVTKIVVDPRYTVEVYGRDLEGRDVWILLHVREPVEFVVAAYADGRTTG